MEKPVGLLVSSPATVSIRFVAGAGQQMVPLEHLVEHDAVDESAEPKSH